VLELGSRREALLADVDGLERFESEYRARLRRALEADLESLAGQGPVAPSGRPPIHDVDLPGSNDSGAKQSAPPLSAPLSSPQPPQTGSAPQSASVDSGPPTAEIRGVSAWDLSNRPTESSSSPSFPSSTPATPEAPSSPVATDATRAPLFPPEQSDGEPLDDEAFFASLREAVSDQAPLGPRDDATAAPSSYESDDEDERSGLFRRRR
jgi:hypothetical protein